MKNIKKLLSIVMVLAMVLALGAQAFAANVVIEPSAGDKADMSENYDFWQIFTGSTTSDTTNEGAANKLGDLDWGKAIGDKSAAFIDKLKSDPSNVFGGLTAGSYAGDGTTGTITAKDVAAFLGATDNSAVANRFAQLAYEFVTENKIGPQYDNLGQGKHEIADGYYLIVEDAPVGEIVNPALLQLTDKGDVTIKQKAEIPTVDKEVGDINDSTGQTETGKTADYDVGDKIPYTLTATIGDGYDKFEKYYLEFSDNMSKGLTYNKDAKVYIEKANNGGGRVDVTSAFVIDDTGASTYEGGTHLSVKCEDTKAQAALNGLQKGDKIVVEYSATLNSDALIGVEGNPNTVTLIFSNNPNDNGGGKSETKPVTAIVFTFDQKVNKVDSKKEPLKGAEFKLVKHYEHLPEGVDAPTTAYSYEALQEAKDGDWFIYGDHYVKVINSVMVDDGTSFDFDRIDDGDYILVETQVPEGYNKAADIEFRVVATHSVDAEGNKTVTLEVLVKNGDDYVKQDGVFTIDMTDGEDMIESDVVNTSGMELPETGGMGTTIFYAVGAILVVGAVILLVTRKRVSGASK